VKKHVGLCAAGFLFVALLCAAQEPKVDFLEGEPSVKMGSGWTALSIGDAVSPDAVIRLGKGSMVELSIPGATLMLTRPGAYRISDLLSARRTLASVGAGKALSASLSRLLSGSGGQESGSGVRSERASPDEPDWMGESAAASLEEGKSLIAAGRYQEALRKLADAVDGATEKERSEIAFAMASAYSASGNTREAIRLAAAIPTDGTEAWAADFVLLQARLLVDSFAFAPAVQLLKDKGGGLRDDPQRAAAYHFLMGLGYRGMGDLGAARESLSLVVGLAGDSDLGKAAAKLLESP
jgi:tetratricopeptide (TPR) repeat protein